MSWAKGDLYQVGGLLAVESALVLEPLPVALNALDLLAIEVGHFPNVSMTVGLGERTTLTHLG